MTKRSTRTLRDPRSPVEAIAQDLMRGVITGPEASTKFAAFKRDELQPGLILSLQDLAKESLQASQVASVLVLSLKERCSLDLAEDARAKSHDIPAWILNLAKQGKVERKRNELLETWKIQSTAEIKYGEMKLPPKLSGRMVIALAKIASLEPNLATALPMLEAERAKRAAQPQTHGGNKAKPEYLSPADIEAVKTLLEAALRASAKSQRRGGSATDEEEGRSGGSRKRRRGHSDASSHEDADDDSQVEGDGQGAGGTSQTPPSKKCRKDDQIRIARSCPTCPSTPLNRLVVWLEEANDVPLTGSPADDFLAGTDFSTKMCHTHVRLSCKAVGLLNSSGRNHLALCSSLLKIQQSSHAAFVADPANREDLATALRPPMERPAQMKYAFREARVGPWVFDNILKHVGRPDARREWEEDGTLVFDDIVDHLAKVEDIINEEFALYLHHYHPDDLKKGWLRNMFYSLTQQIIRTDPVVYGINVALRKDNGHRLVASGYVTKYAHGQAGIVTGDGTGFLHMDGDLVALVEQGKNENMLTCGVSLNDEDEDNCTIVVHGSHRHSAAILATLREHGAANATAVTTTDFNKTWRKYLQPHFGSPTPVPCKKWGMRISQLGVVHGSTNKSTIERKVTFPWYICYGSDYEHSDIADTHTHAEQQANHSLCRPPTKEPSGKKPKATAPPILPWSISMTPRHALGQAIVAGIRYEHPQVVHEMDQLFSPDKAVFKHYVETTRANSLQQLRETWRRVLEIESRSFEDPSVSFANARQAQSQV